MKKTISILVLLIIVIGLLWAAPGDETVTLTSQNVRNEYYRYEVWDATVTGTWDIDDTAAVTQAITVNGIIQKVIFSVPDSTNNVAFKVQILDNENKTIFDSGDQTENADYAFSLHEPVTGTIDIVLTPAGATGDSTLDCIVVLRGI